MDSPTPQPRTPLVPPDIAEENELINSRVIPAPRERVFEAFADPAQLAKWWGPNGFTNKVGKFDFRVGGRWEIVMQGPDGAVYDNESEFTEIVKPERIVYTHLQPFHRFEMKMLFAFTNHNETRLTWRMRFADAGDFERVREHVIPANEQNFDRLVAHLAGAPLKP